MRNTHRKIWLGLITTLLFISCEVKDTREFFPHSTPVIESASINPSTFTYGDSVTISTKVSDAETPLSTLEMKMIINDKIVATQSIRTRGNSAEISSKFKVPFMSELPDNANVEVILNLINVEGDITTGSISGITGKRTFYNKLYLVKDDGSVVILTPGTNRDQYLSSNIKIKGNSIRYKIAEKITKDNQIDFSGYVWGFQNGIIQPVDESGDYITTTNEKLRYIDNIKFDSYLFETQIDGAEIDPNNLTLNLDDFADVTIDNEVLKKVILPIKKDQTLVLEDDLANKEVVFNMDYFERIDNDLVKFIGDEGNYELYYSESRKIVVVNPSANRAYPNILLVCGEGLGYPSTIKPQAHTAWDFNAPLKAIIFKKVAENVYQGTVYLDVTKANFKPFENKDWGNEKPSTDYTMPAILAKDTDLGKTDGNWYAKTSATTGNYRITINLATKVVTATAVTLP